MTDAGLRSRADEVFRRLDSTLDAAQRSWLETIPLARTIEVFDAYPPGSPVRIVTDETRVLFADLERQGGEAWVDRHMRLVLAMLLVRTLIRPLPYVLAPSVAAALASERHRILDDVESPTSEPYVLGGLLVRDLAFVLGTSLPFGVFLEQLWSTIPDVLLERSGVAAPAFPWLRQHISVDPGTGLTPEARRSAYAGVAVFLAADSQHHGIFGVGWTFDPALSEISPHLTISRTIPLEGGGVIVSAGPGDEHTVEHATMMSRTRRRLYEEGRYVPMDYALVWRRVDLVRWAATQEVRDGA